MAPAHSPTRWPPAEQRGRELHMPYAIHPSGAPGWEPQRVEASCLRLHRSWQGGGSIRQLPPAPRPIPQGIAVLPPSAHLAAHIGVFVGDRCLNLLGCVGQRSARVNSARCAAAQHQMRPPERASSAQPRSASDCARAQPGQLPTGSGKPLCTACSEVVPTHQSKLCR